MKSGKEYKIILSAEDKKNKINPRQFWIKYLNEKKWVEMLKDDGESALILAEEIAGIEVIKEKENKEIIKKEKEKK